MFVSCVRASGRGEAVWACERGVIVNAGGLHSNISSSSSPAPAVLCSFAFLLLCSWVLRLFETFGCYAHGFFDLVSFLLLCSWVF